MNIGTLNIEIATNVARIQADMQAAKQAVGTAMAGVESYVNTAKSALVGLIGIGTVDAFKGMIMSGIEAKARLYDLSLQTGISVEALGGLGKAAKLSNTSLDDVAGASNKLSKALFTQNEDSKGAASAIKALGLNFDQFKQLAPEQQMLAIAKAMDGFKDGTGKAGAAMELWGKSGAQLLPLMKELASATDLTSKQTTEAAIQAKEFEDNLKKLKTASEAWKREIVNETLPGLTALSKQMLEAKTIGEKFSVVLGNIADNAGFSALDRQRKDLENLQLRISAANTGYQALLGVQQLLPNAMKGLTEGGIQAQRQELDRLRAAAISASDALKSSANTIAGVGGGPLDTRHFPPKPELMAPADRVPRGAAPADPYIALVATLREKLEVERMELNMGRNLTASEKESLDVMVKVRDGKLKLTEARALETRGLLEERTANEKLNRQRDEDASLRAKMQTDMQTEIEAQFANTKAAREAAAAMKLSLDQYGMTNAQLQALSATRDRDTAAALRQNAANSDTTRDGGALSDYYLQQADAMQQLAAMKDMLAAKEARDHDDPLTGANRAVKDYMADVKRAGDATYGAVSNSIKGLEDLTVSALTGGNARNAARAWVNSLLSEFLRLKTVKPLIANLLGESGGGSGGGWLSTVGSLFGSYFGGGGMSTNTTGGSLPTSGGRASGGPVDGGKNYLVGEKGPEILRMGSQAGTVVPNDAIGGGSRSVVVNVTNNGQAVQAKSSQRETSQGTIIDLVLDAVANDMASGGKLHDATQRRFGLSAGGSTPRY